MRKVFLTILSIVTVLNVSAKTKDLTLTVDFSGGNPLTAVQGTTPETVTIDSPACGIALAGSSLKTFEEAEPFGYVNCPNQEKGQEGFYLPFNRQFFQSEGQDYEFVIGSIKSPGKKTHAYIGKGLLVTAKVAFSFPKVKGYVPAGLKVYTVKNSQNVNERTYFHICTNKISAKNDIANTNPAEPGMNTEMEASFNGVTQEDMVIAYTYANFKISKIQFVYKPAPKK